MTRLLSLLFGCRHKHRTWPLTVNGVTWQACLDCGACLDYDPAKVGMCGHKYEGAIR